MQDFGHQGGNVVTGPLVCLKHGVDFALTAVEWDEHIRWHKRNAHQNEASFDFSEWRREIDHCKVCRAARVGLRWWDRLEAATGIEVGFSGREMFGRDANRRMLNRQRIRELSHRLQCVKNYYADGPRRRGRPVLPAADGTARYLIHVFEAAGGTAEVRIKNESDRQPGTSFEHFIELIWPQLPDDSSIRLQSWFQLARRCRDVKRLRRNRERGLLKVSEMETIWLKNISPVSLHGRASGKVFSVPGEDGEVWANPWRNRLEDGDVVIVEPDANSQS